MTTRILRSLAAVLAVAVLAARAAAQTPDSAFAVSKSGASLFRVNVDAGAKFGGTFDGDGGGTGVPIEGAGTRMMWYPRKAAFRAGYVNGTQWDAANIGAYSVALGINVRASGDSSVALGASATAAQAGAFAAGVHVTASGAASVALGYAAHTNARQGAFVFADRSTVTDTLRAGVANSASWRVNGGFRIFTSSNLTTGVTIQNGTVVSNWGQTNAIISTSQGAYMGTDGNWYNPSDVHRKHLFADVSGEDVLMRLRALPIQTWSYRVDANDVRHLGPTAQDFRAAFGLGRDSVTITAIDEGGVALTAIKALDARTSTQAARVEAVERDNAALRAENAELRARLERIERMLSTRDGPPEPAPRR